MQLKNPRKEWRWVLVHMRDLASKKVIMSRQSCSNASALFLLVQMLEKTTLGNRGSSFVRFLMIFSECFSKHTCTRSWVCSRPRRKWRKANHFLGLCLIRYENDTTQSFLFNLHVRLFLPPTSVLIVNVHVSFISHQRWSKFPAGGRGWQWWGSQK